MNPYQTTLINSARGLCLTAMLLLAPTTHAAPAVPVEDSHAGHDHAPGVEHAEAPRVEVTKQQVDRLGIKITPATTGSINRTIRVPGEIKINADQVAHVVPRAPGVVREVTRALGDSVKAGDILGWVESAELGEAKLDFFAKEAEVGCCEFDLPRAKAIQTNVARLMALLRKEGTNEEIRALDGLEMGPYRGELLTGYSAYRAARITYEREAALHAKKVSSGRELLDAEAALDQAKAAFHAMLDGARYDTMIAYIEAVQIRQVAVFEAVAAEKRLRLKGADSAAIDALRALVPKVATAEPCLCDDPNCADGTLPSVSETLGKDGRLAWYALRAPLAGMLIKKHIVMGESLDTTSEVFTIADLNSVWVDLTVSQDAMLAVQTGQTATVTLPDGTTAAATITFVSPLVARETRTALARAILENRDERFRPGTFIEAAIQLPSAGAAVVVPKASVQLVEDYPCLFVWNQGAFELREVTTGNDDGRQVEILKGLKAGEAVAAVNAFHLKAEYIKSAAGERGAHEGHSH